MAILEGAVNTTINGGTFIAGGSNEGRDSKFSASDDVVDILHSRSATAGLLDAAERFDAPKCDGGTRVSMLRGMKNFVREGGFSSLSTIYWLHGPAGVGKSALAQSLALSLKDEGDHAASFFFSRTAPGRNDGNQLIVTLAYQLAVNLPALQPFVLKTVKKNPSVLTSSNTVKMQSLIIDPINGWYKKYRWSIEVRWWVHKILNTDKKLHPRLILVDGLDECNDAQVQRDLILCIALAVRQLSLPFRFVITSRPESQILATFELDPIFQGLDSVKVRTKNLGDDEDADEQINTFLLKEFGEIRRTHPIRDFLPREWPVPGQIAQLVSKSSKGFIYPATVIRYIKMPNNRPDECLERILGLSEIPIRDKPYEPLDNLYRYIFNSVLDVNKEAVWNIFHFLVVPSNLNHLITPRLIEKYFNYKPGHVHHVLHDLLCVVTIASIDHPIKVLHASLPDFLLDQSRSGPLRIYIGDAHATIAASFPLIFSDTGIAVLPDFRLVGFLEHIMRSDMSSTPLYHEIVDVDFRTPYIKTCDVWLSYKDNRHDKTIFLFEPDIEGIAFVAAYLLVLVIKNVQQTDIRRHITKMKNYILRKHPFATSLYGMRDKLVPAMIPLFFKWASSTIDHEYINYIFASEVNPAECKIREEILEIYLLMWAPFYDLTTGDKNYLQNIHRLPHAQQLTVYSNHISYTLLEYLLCDFDQIPSVRSLKHLATDLLGVSLAHAGYSATLMTILNNLFLAENGLAKFSGQLDLRRLATSVTDCLKRVYLEAPTESQKEIQELTDLWKQYMI